MNRHCFAFQFTESVSLNTQVNNAEDEMTAFKNDNLPVQLFKDIPLFIHAVRLGSFTKAAAKLGIPLPTFSRRIAGMEKLMGFQMFCRKGPKIDLTDYGRLFFDGCQALVSQVEETLEELSEESLEPRGTVRILIHWHIYQMYMPSVVENFVRKWPEIQLDIRMSSTMNDLLEKNYDLAITAGSIPDAGLKVRKLLSVSPRLYASPKLIETFGMPRTPDELESIPCISFSQMDNFWHLKRQDQERHIHICSRHITDSPLIAKELARAGSGIAMLAPAIVNVDEKNGVLRGVLTDWTIPEIIIYTVRPPVQPPKRVRLFMDYIFEYLSTQFDVSRQ